MNKKDARVNLRLSAEERTIFEEVAEALGCESISQTLRFVMRERHRDLFGNAAAKHGRAKRVKGARRGA